jgi:hypothetical protein
MTNCSPNTNKTNLKYIPKGRNIMANKTIIIPNATLFFVKVEPNSPAKPFAGDGSPSWETQIRTTSKDVAKQWKEMDLNVRALSRNAKDDDGNVMTDDLGETLREPIVDDNGNPYYGVTVRKKTHKFDGSKQNPVNVVGGDLSPVDPATIGNGSVGNLSVFQYPYEYKGKKGISSMLMAIQVTELNEYKPRPQNGGFSPVAFKVNKIADNQEVDADMLGGDIDDDLDF